MSDIIKIILGGLMAIVIYSLGFSYIFLNETNWVIFTTGWIIVVIIASILDNKISKKKLENDKDYQELIKSLSLPTKRH